jgi:hypothetical protein
MAYSPQKAQLSNPRSRKSRALLKHRALLQKFTSRYELLSAPSAKHVTDIDAVCGCAKYRVVAQALMPPVIVAPFRGHVVVRDDRHALRAAEHILARFHSVALVPVAG